MPFHRFALRYTLCSITCSLPWRARRSRPSRQHAPRRRRTDQFAFRRRTPSRQTTRVSRAGLTNGRGSRARVRSATMRAHVWVRARDWGNDRAQGHATRPTTPNRNTLSERRDANGGCASVGVRTDLDNLEAREVGRRLARGRALHLRAPHSEGGGVVAVVESGVVSAGEGGGGGGLAVCHRRCSRRSNEPAQRILNSIAIARPTRGATPQRPSLVVFSGRRRAEGAPRSPRRLSLDSSAHGRRRWRASERSRPRSRLFRADAP